MNNNIGIAALLLSIGLIISSAILGIYWKDSRSFESYVTVKGLSEREVYADRAWMAVSTSFGSNSVEDVRAVMSSQETKIRSYLTEKGFAESEIITDNINIYENEYKEATYRFSANLRVTVTSKNVDAIEKASGDKTGLIERGVLVSGDKWSNGPKYYYTQFTDIKTEMIAEATKEAEKAAKEFASTSGAKVGKIRRANQGIFQILPGDRSTESEEFYKDKVIRVVSTLDFYLD